MVYVAWFFIACSAWLATHAIRTNYWDRAIMATKCAARCGLLSLACIAMAALIKHFNL